MPLTTVAFIDPGGWALSSSPGPHSSGRWQRRRIARCPEIVPLTAIASIDPGGWAVPEGAQGPGGGEVARGGERMG